jgi:hypothetical protein
MAEYGDCPSRWKRNLKEKLQFAFLDSLEEMEVKSGWTLETKVDYDVFRYVVDRNLQNLLDQVERLTQLKPVERKPILLPKIKFISA